MGDRRSADRFVAHCRPPYGVVRVAGAFATWAGTPRSGTDRLPGPAPRPLAAASRTPTAGAQARMSSSSASTVPVCRPAAPRGAGRVRRSGADSTRARTASRGRGPRRKRSPRQASLFDASLPPSMTTGASYHAVRRASHAARLSIPASTTLYRPAASTPPQRREPPRISEERRRLHTGGDGHSPKPIRCAGGQGRVYSPARGFPEGAAVS